MKTNLYTVLCVAVRLGAVLMAIKFLEGLLSIALFITNHNYPMYPLFAYSVGLLVTIMLWVRPGLLAWWAAGRKGEVFESNISAEQLQYIAFAVLGAWFFINGIGQLFQQATIFLAGRAQDPDASYATMPNSIWAGLVQGAVLMIMGGAFAFGARGLAALLQRMRGHHVTYIQDEPDTSASKSD